MLGTLIAIHLIAFTHCNVLFNDTVNNDQVVGGRTQGINCDIKIVGKFIKCSVDNDSLNYKCLMSNKTYEARVIRQSRQGYMTVTSLCENDQYFYQACGLGAGRDFQLESSKWILDSSDYPCGYLCKRPNGIYHLSTLQSKNLVCTGRDDCSNTDLDDDWCSAGSEECDMVCSLNGPCDDESVCGGYRYGVPCGGGSSTSHLIRSEYIHPMYLCDGYPHCGKDLDEQNCAVEEGTPSCIHINGHSIPLHNYTRCSTLFYKKSHPGVIGKLGLITVCLDFMDQTNCSDPSRVGVFCPINGYMSSVARQIICLTGNDFYANRPPQINQLCDDGLDKACVQFSRFCYLHKHFMCDGERDCEDGSDETHEHCQVMTKKTYRRRFNKKTAAMKIPLQWVGDGQVDCWKGEDESEEWPKCGNGTTERFVRHGTICQEVFLCYDSFVELTQLCDMRESCSNENAMCAVSRGRVQTNGVVLKDQHFYSVSYCLKGLSSLETLHETFCKVGVFRTGTNVIGMNMTTKIRSPNKQHDCTHFYGEYYVYLSCLGLCRNSSCPLHKRPRMNSCPAQYENKKLFTASYDGELTLLLRERRTNELGVRLFVCENNRCVGYEKVCNLVDDCGDASDEAFCTNHFLCNSSNEYIPLVHKCDRVFHCSDMSDECNGSCGLRIISHSYLKVLACIIGFSATLLNCISLYNNIRTILKSKSEPALVTHGLMTIICIGDLLMGCYLATITSFDFYYSSSYCLKHFEWITSDSCAALGVISTLASYLPLFAMTLLGIQRALGVKQDFAIPKEVTRSSVFKLLLMAFAIVLASFFIALLPLMKNLEEFFDNGARFETFNPLFQASLNKKTFLAILDNYYGRIMLRNGDIPWLKVQGLAASMFSRDYSGVKFKRQTFYGNDAVCLFKYFVSQDDPQSTFVVPILGLNFSCFLLITLSYGQILKKVKRTAKAISKQNTTKEKEKHEHIAQLQRITFFVIFTDFVCWVPFIVICSFHYIGVLDATFLYPFFTIVILPINSVINPLLYDKILNEKLTVICLTIKKSFVKILEFLAQFKGIMDSNVVDAMPQAQENIELHDLADNMTPRIHDQQ